MDGSRHSYSVLLVAIMVMTAVHLWLRDLTIPDLYKVREKEATVSEPIEVSRWDERDKDKGIVQSSKVDDPEAKDAEAKYYGTDRNRTKKEMQSVLKGTYQQGGPLIQGGDSGVEDPEGAQRGVPNVPMADLLRLGRTPYVISDTPLGTDTVLNTDPIVHASFFYRMTDLISSAWNPLFHDVVEQLPKERKLKPDSYTTRVKVFFNREGTVTEIRVLKSCGIDEFDHTVVQAFWNIGKFDNPPKQIFEDVDYSSVEYTFLMNIIDSVFRVLPHTA